MLGLVESLGHLLYVGIFYGLRGECFRRDLVLVKRRAVTTLVVVSSGRYCRLKLGVD